MTGSQCDRVLRVLADGKWKTVPTVHRKAGMMRLNSRVAELRQRGYRIECERVAGRKGAGAYRYRLDVAASPPIPADPLAMLPPVSGDFELTADQFAPRDERNRYRLYALTDDDDLRLIATCATPEAVGVAIVTLAEEGEFKLRSIGLMDSLAEDSEKWKLNPWDARAR